MLVPSTRLFQAGEVETGAYLNSAVTNLGNFMLGKPIAQMRQTVAQTFTNSTAAAVTFTTEDVDRDNGHSNSVNTSRYTAQTAGWYRISGATSFASNTTGVRAAYWYLNGSQLSLTQAVTRSTLIAGLYEPYYANNFAVPKCGRLHGIVGVPKFWRQLGF
jgi:hypothetical protein